MFLAAAVAGCGWFGPWPGKVTLAQPEHRTSDGDRPAALDPARAIEELVSSHNRLRAEVKLHSLEPNRKLQAAAEAHTRDMAARHKMTHEGRDGSTPTSRISDQGYRPRRCAENIAFGPKTCETVMKGWMNSPPHKANILGSFSQIGAAYATAADGTPFWCVTFGLPARRK
jgi:uncharacterized protein YkwD